MCIWKRFPVCTQRRRLLFLRDAPKENICRTHAGQFYSEQTQLGQYLPRLSVYTLCSCRWPSAAFFVARGLSENKSHAHSIFASDATSGFLSAWLMLFTAGWRWILNLCYASYICACINNMHSGDDKPRAKEADRPLLCTWLRSWKHFRVRALFHATHSVSGRLFSFVLMTRLYDANFLEPANIYVGRRVLRKMLLFVQVYLVNLQTTVPRILY